MVAFVFGRFFGYEIDNNENQTMKIISLGKITIITTIKLCSLDFQHPLIFSRR